jgi:TM2 domain-containing membrane protein YozV
MRSIITFVLVSVCLWNKSSADNTDLNYPDSLLKTGALKEASLAYEQVIYDNPADTLLHVTALLHKTECLKQQGLFDRIEPMLRRVSNIQMSDSLKFVLLYEKSLGCYLSENFDKAEQLLLPVFNIEINTVQLHASKILYSLILNEMGRWMEASSVLTAAINSDVTLTDDEKQKGLTIVADLYSKKNMPVLRSIIKARTLSLLFPGLGQLYNGNTGTAALSFTFVSLSGLYIAYNIINTTYLTAATSGAYLFLYFYFGGVNQANVLVPQKNYYKKTNYNNYLRKSLVTLNNDLYNK